MQDETQLRFLDRFPVRHSTNPEVACTGSVDGSGSSRYEIGTGQISGIRQYSRFPFLVSPIHAGDDRSGTADVLANARISGAPCFPVNMDSRATDVEEWHTAGNCGEPRVGGDSISPQCIDPETVYPLHLIVDNTIAMLRQPPLASSEQRAHLWLVESSTNMPDQQPQMQPGTGSLATRLSNEWRNSSLVEHDQAEYSVANYAARLVTVRNPRTTRLPAETGARASVDSANATHRSTGDKLWAIVCSWISACQRICIRAVPFGR